jgi:hypothetical protein
MLRRFPPPWTIEEFNGACFVVIDSAGQRAALAYLREAPNCEWRSSDKSYPRYIHGNVVRPNRD